MRNLHRIFWGRGGQQIQALRKLTFWVNLKVGSLILFSGKRDFHLVEKVDTHKPFHKGLKMTLCGVYHS